MKTNSNLSDYISKHRRTFGHLNGVHQDLHQEYMKQSNRLKQTEMKQKILSLHFDIKPKEANNYILFVYVNRVTKMKGLLLLLESIEILLREHYSYCLFFIRGKTDGSEYSMVCQDKIEQLKEEFPKNMNADISHFVLNKYNDFYL